ncbi:TetR/AcrR family transcriptional regulator [Pseudactinotalea suaedae]|uniref:TetR/AcrR family transcriptional regulator n=1 Tax=Pseudactinotalea suaedae TaxID=1524924 RepID=UPI0012E23BD1|nr:TetR/AcrR family transcriptional regulator [Pseudactinotalea suaedae]
MTAAAPPMLTAVLDVARRQLGEVGPAALSLRAIAREVGVVPSALYRYLPGREAILTELIRSGYERLAGAVTEAEAAVPRADHLTRWRTTWRATREWAVAHPHEYALLYGTPVVGYRAPTETVGPATRVVLTLAQVAVDAQIAGARAPASEELGPEVMADAEAVRALLPELGLAVEVPIDPRLVMLVIDGWTTLFGAISFELFGHYERSVTARAEHLDLLARRRAAALGIVALGGATGRDHDGEAQSQA